MPIFDDKDIETRWNAIQNHFETMSYIVVNGQAEYDLGPTSEHVNIGEYFDRSIPDDVQSLEDQGLVWKYLEEQDGDDAEEQENFTAVYQPTVTGKGLFEKESLDEAMDWSRQLDEWADNEYSS